MCRRTLASPRYTSAGRHATRRSSGERLDRHVLGVSPAASEGRYTSRTAPMVVAT
jgi:hypothetical protein